MAVGIFTLIVSLLAPTLVGAQHTRNVVLVTVDGLRHQELFGGIDRNLLDGDDASGIEDVEGLRRAFWRESEQERRIALMPFFWQELAPRGIVLRSSIANPHKNSFPGYSEILTGRVVPEITGNIDVQIPRDTVLDVAKRELQLDDSDVAAFTSWDHFHWIVSSERDSFFVNAGYQRVPEALAYGDMKRWSELQFRVLSPWNSVRHNVITVGLALAYVDSRRPRVLFVALDETDEWAHARRYDRTIQAIRSFDDTLRELWTKLQAMGVYRDRTTLFITTDHGRGATQEDWTSHGSDVKGCDDTWIAIIGPDTPARGVVDTPAEHSQIAPTILALLGLDPALLGSGAGTPIDIALP